MSREKLDKLWELAAANPGKKIDVGRLVVCDICDKDYTDSDESGGFVFGSSGYCPKCAPEQLEVIKKYNEEHFIKAHCPTNLSFSDFVRAYRGDKNYIQINNK